MTTTTLPAGARTTKTGYGPETALGIDAVTASATATIFKALSDPARLRLLSIVASHPDGEVCVCDLTGPIDLSQPTVSHHMSILVKAGLVVREQRGKWAYFSLAHTATQTLRVAATTVLGTAQATPHR